VTTLGVARATPRRPGSWVTSPVALQGLGTIDGLTLFQFFFQIFKSISDLNSK
jgi:hypothetical protein